MAQCMNCDNPAIPSSGTLPLCARCAELAKENQRGVKYETPQAPEVKPEPQQPDNDDQRPSS